MNKIPQPLTLNEIISLNGVEGSEDAYEDDHGFIYEGKHASVLYYGGDAFNGGRPFTGLYYELYDTGELELYSYYNNGVPVKNMFTFYKKGTVKSYHYFSEDRMNDYFYKFDEAGNLIQADIWENGNLKRQSYK